MTWPFLLLIGVLSLAGGFAAGWYYGQKQGREYWYRGLPEDIYVTRGSDLETTFYPKEK